MTHGRRYYKRCSICGFHKHRDESIPVLWDRIGRVREYVCVGCVEERKRERLIETMG